MGRSICDVGILKEAQKRAWEDSETFHAYHDIMNSLIHYILLNFHFIVPNYKYYYFQLSISHSPFPLNASYVQSLLHLLPIHSLHLLDVCPSMRRRGSHEFHWGPPFRIRIYKFAFATFDRSNEVSE